MPAYTCWEYDIIVIKEDKENPDHDDLEGLVNQLKVLGQIGWEAWGTLGDDVVLIKRPIDGHGLTLNNTDEVIRRKRPERRQTHMVENN
jgi:hypothetical protein